MTKVQKIWLGVFLAIALVPEILFQSTIRLVHGVITIKGITFGHKYTVVLIQSISLLILSILMFIWRKQFHRRAVFYVMLGLLLLWALVGYVAYYDALYGRVEVRGF